ncbi:hypothetical protein FB451DRAFT_148409 [Mycena latifolia]|nr:hypothetical protein FB451DRAFT_148409 [Mycena latifolia]
MTPRARSRSRESAPTGSATLAPHQPTQTPPLSLARLCTRWRRCPWGSRFTPSPRRQRYLGAGRATRERLRHRGTRRQLQDEARMGQAGRRVRRAVRGRGARQDRVRVDVQQPRLRPQNEQRVRVHGDSQEEYSGRRGRVGAAEVRGVAACAWWRRRRQQLWRRSFDDLGFSDDGLGFSDEESDGEDSDGNVKGSLRWHYRRHKMGIYNY